MTSLTNLRRDMNWKAETSLRTTPTESPSYLLPVVNTSGVVQGVHSLMQSSENILAGTATYLVSFGAKTQWPLGIGFIPFRIKGYSNTEETMWGVGWENTGASEVSALYPLYFHYGKNIDDVVNLREPAGIDETYHLVFFASVPSDMGRNMCGMSVQRLLGQPDPYSASVF